MKGIQKLRDDSLGEYEIPDPDAEDPVVVVEEEQKEDVSSPQANNFLNAPPIINARFQACVEAMDAEDFQKSHISSLVKAVDLIIPKRHLTDFQQWKDVEAVYGPIRANRKVVLKEEEFHDRYDAIVEVAKEIGFAGRAAQQGEPAKFLSFASLYPLQEEL